jgi:serine/threonine-protein kinase
MALHPLLDIDRIDDMPESYLLSTGGMFALFDERTQDSGNVSYGVELDGKRYFIKTAGSPEDTAANLSHQQRVTYLLNAVSLAESCDHPALPRLYNVIQSPQGPMLVYAWASGELLHASRGERSKTQAAFQRFRQMPLESILVVLDTIYELHHQLCEVGWVAMDFYDGCMLYDFDKDEVHIVDLDMYHLGAFVNTVGRLFGSSRFMAPEEFILGAMIDERTTTYTMGRTAAIFLSDGSLMRSSFRGTDEQFSVMIRACTQNREERYPSIAEFYCAWWDARNS